jgi:polyhydroxyalkanoate synthesis regulator phasin
MFSDALKKIFYTGIGIAAVTVEKTGEIVDTLEQKGQQAVKEGKIISEELKQKMAAVESNVKDVLDSLEKMSKEQIEQIKEKLSEVENVVDVAEEDAKTDAESVLSSLEKMSKEEIESVKARIEEISKSWKDENQEG